MQIINLYDEHKRKAVISLCPQKLSAPYRENKQPPLGSEES